MGLTIQGRSDQGLQALQKAQDSMLQGMRRLASAKRVATAADDAAGLAIAQRLAAAEASRAQGERNLQDGDSMAATAEGTLAQQSELLQRMRELTVQAQDGSLTPTDRVQVQQEYRQLSEQLTQAMASTAFGDRPLLDGSLRVSLHDGQAPADVMEFPDTSAATLGVGGKDVADPATVDAIDRAIDRVSQARAEAGTTQEKIGHQVESARSAREQLASTRSRIEDADLAYEVASRTRDQLLLASGVALQVHRRTADSVLSRLVV